MLDDRGRWSILCKLRITKLKEETKYTTDKQLAMDSKHMC